MLWLAPDKEDCTKPLWTHEKFMIRIGFKAVPWWGISLQLKGTALNVFVQAVPDISIVSGIYSRILFYLNPEEMWLFYDGFLKNRIWADFINNFLSFPNIINPNRLGKSCPARGSFFLFRLPDQENKRKLSAWKIIFNVYVKMVIKNWSYFL